MEDIPVDMLPMNTRWCLYADNDSCRSVDLYVRYYSEEEDCVKSSVGSDESILVSSAWEEISLIRKNQTSTPKTIGL